MNKNPLRSTVAGALLTVGALAGLSGVAGAATSGTTGPAGTSGPVSSSGPVGTTKLDQAKITLEKQLALRSTRLAELGTDVSGAKSLTPAHATELSSRLISEQASIDGLITKVPTDTTLAQVSADRATMLKDNRVFAVMSPQVFETIGGDAVRHPIPSSRQSSRACLLR